MNYWSEKDKLKTKAKKHTIEMEQKYSDKIKESINTAIIYDNTLKLKNSKTLKNKSGIIFVDEIDSVTAIEKYYEKDEKIAILNFASYKNPGGMFLQGSKAQEECLCHDSNLYNVLSNFENTYYAWNNLHKNKALYLDRALYTKDIIFRDKYKVDVITCAAPNKTVAQRYLRISDEENSKVLKERIRFILNIAVENDIDTLILGAYGAGVFGQDATEVANIFKAELENDFVNSFENVVFAIIKGENYDKMNEVLKNM